MDIKSCPICGNKFLCYQNSDCWCAKFPNILPDPSKDCLCPNCLKKAAMKQGYLEDEIPQIVPEKKVLITVEKIDGHCPVFKVGDKILISNGEVDLKNSDAFCIHASQVLHFYALSLREGIDPVNLGLAIDSDKAYVQCPDPGPPYTNGGSVLFSLTKI